MTTGPSPWPSRAVARSTLGMVASPHPLATAAGVAVLRSGGNAVDAAIATNAVLAVVYPASCGLGGDAFWLVHDRARRTTVAVNGSGRAPHAAGSAPVPPRGARSVTVPGAVRSWEDVAREHGTRTLDEILIPAERLARNGFALTDVVVAYLRLYEPLLRRDAEATRIYLEGGVPHAGDVQCSPDLANTLLAIRRRGADALYTGPIAQRIVDALAAAGSTMTLEDLALHRTETTAPMQLAWRGAHLLAHPPNAQGGALLVAAGILEDDGDAGEALWHHLAVEAWKRAAAIRDRGLCDPAFGADPFAERLAPASLRALRASIDPERALPFDPAARAGGTIAICVVDEDGNAVSLMQSLYTSFGAGIVAPGTGVILNNRGDCFSQEPGHPNAPDGGKRPLHTLCPTMLLRDGEPELVLGTMGGDGQPQILLQVLHAIADRGMDVQRAVDAPRWLYARRQSPDGPDPAAPVPLSIESRAAPELASSLARRGHAVETVGPYANAMGHAQAIAIDRERGTLAGGADPRADSLALGL